MAGIIIKMTKPKKQKRLSLFGRWNREFDKGVSPFQIALAVSMVIGAFTNNNLLIFFSMFTFLFAYFEPTDLRWHL